MDVGRILNTPSNPSHPSEASAENSASNLRQLAEIASASASTPTTNVHETAATTDEPAPQQDANANDAPAPQQDARANNALPYPGFDPDYDDERRPPPEVNPASDNGSPTPPPPKKNCVHKEPPKVNPIPRTTSSANPHLTDTSSAAQTPAVWVHGTRAASSSSGAHPILPRIQSIFPPASRPIDSIAVASSSSINFYGRASASVRGGPRKRPPLPGITSPLTSRQPFATARYSNGVLDLAEIVDVDASVARPTATARSSNGFPDVAEIINVDAPSARPTAVARSSNGFPDVAEIIDVDAPVARPNIAARDSNRISDDVEIIKEIIDADAPVTRLNESSNRNPDVAEIIDVDAPVARPNVARSSNGFPDVAEIVDADAWEARPRTQIASPPSDLSVQVGSSAPVSPVQAFCFTFSVSELEQNAIGFLASNSRCRDIPQDDNPFPGQETLPWYNLDIEIALKYKYDREFGAALIGAAVDKCHKADESRNGKQREDNSSSEYESCDEDCEIGDEDAANLEYIYIKRAPRNGNEPRTIRAHPGDAVWAMVGSRSGTVDASRRWKRGCGHCNPEDREHTIPLEEDREPTIPLEEAAVDDEKTGRPGAAYYNPNLYTTTSSMRETRIKPPPPKPEREDKPISSNRTSPSSSDKAPNSRSKGKGKQKANGYGNFNESKHTPPPASDRTTISRSIAMGLRREDSTVNNNASGTPARSPSPTRSSLRNRQLFGPQPLPPLPPLAPFSIVASLSRRSQGYVPSPLGQTVELSSNATTPEPVQTSSSSTNRTKTVRKEDDDEQGRKGGKKNKNEANNKRKASEAIDEDADATCIRPTARPRRNITSNSSNTFSMSGALQDNQSPSSSAAASGTLTLPAAESSQPASSSSGTRSSNLPGVAAGNVSPDAVGARSRLTGSEREGESERRVLLRLTMAAEADPEHPGHEMYMLGRAMSRQRGKESRRRG